MAHPRGAPHVRQMGPRMWRTWCAAPHPLSSRRATTCLTTRQQDRLLPTKDLHRLGDGPTEVRPAAIRLPGIAADKLRVSSPRTVLLNRKLDGIPGMAPERLIHPIHGGIFADGVPQPISLTAIGEYDHQMSRLRL